MALTGLSPARLGDLGLEQFSVSELFSSILIPGFFLLACILQLHYFHRPFMQLTDLEHVPPPGARRTRWAHRCGSVPWPVSLPPLLPPSQCLLVLAGSLGKTSTRQGRGLGQT